MPQHLRFQTPCSPYHLRERMVKHPYIYGACNKAVSAPTFENMPYSLHTILPSSEDCPPGDIFIRCPTTGQPVPTGFHKLVERCGRALIVCSCGSDSGIWVELLREPYACYFKGRTPSDTTSRLCDARPSSSFITTNVVRRR